jgi:transcriptional regulator with XRE-family HTH domain|tara:strand:+ start:506 stop:877 length:372 start_codon:yes stop_codon:yes gene_type:complete
MAKRLAQSDWTADDLRAKREALGMNKAEMSRRLGVTYRQYMYYEKGHTRVSKGLEQFINDLLNPTGSDKEKSQGTLSDFEKHRITRLLNALQNHPLDDLDDKTQKILRQTSEEIVLLLSKLSN